MHGRLHFLQQGRVVSSDLLAPRERNSLHLVLLLQKISFGFAGAKEFVSRTLVDNHINGIVFVIPHKYATIRNISILPYFQDRKLVAFGDWNHGESEVPQFALQAKIQGV